MKVTKLEIQTQLKISRKKPCRELSSRTIPQVPSLREKLNESQFAACNSIKPKRSPTHALICATVWHLPSAEANHATVVTLFVDEKVFRRTKHLVDSLVAVFADVGNTFKGSKNFSDHIFYGLNLVDCKAHVKSKNFTVTT